MKVKYHRLQRLCENSEIPPTRVDGLFRSNLQRRASRICESHQRKLVDGSDPSYRGELSESANPTNGSWWIVQILPFRPRTIPHDDSLSALNESRLIYPKAGSEPSTNFRWWDLRTLSIHACRWDLNHPPTSVGGIA